MKSAIVRFLFVSLVVSFAACCQGANDPGGYLICVSNEKSGDVTLIDGSTHAVVQTIPVGKRPRGIHASQDGKLVYVAVSGTPVSGPPKLDGKGDPIFEKEDEKNSDHSLDGIAVLDLRELRVVKRLPSGSDPEQFSLNTDGKQIYISNEDKGTVSVMDVVYGEVKHVIPVKEEPEGVNLSPDGKFMYVTCETRGEVFVIDTASHKSVAEFTVGGRPRNVAFLPDGSYAFVPSESSGTLHVVETSAHKVLKSVKLPPGSRPMG